MPLIKALEDLKFFAVLKECFAQTIPTDTIIVHRKIVFAQKMVHPCRLFPLFRVVLPDLLDRPALLLGRDARRPGGGAGAGGPADFWPNQRCADQVLQAQDGVCPVLLLGAVLFGLDQDLAVVGRPRPGQFEQALFNLRRQRRRIGRVEAQLHRRGDLVDVLPARPAGAHKFNFDFLVRNRENGADFKHK